MMRFPSLTGGLILALLVIISGCVLIQRHQHLRIETLSEKNTVLEKQNEELSTQLISLHEVADIFSEHRAQQYNLEKSNENDRRAIQDALKTIPCASQPVPDDIIRMQYEIFSSGY